MAAQQVPDAIKALYRCPPPPLSSADHAWHWSVGRVSSESSVPTEIEKEQVRMIVLCCLFFLQEHGLMRRFSAFSN